MKKMIAFALSTVMALSLVSCTSQTNPGSSSGSGSDSSVEPAAIGGDPATWGPALDGDGSGVQIPSPITEYTSMEEAAAAAGFDMTAPETIDGYTERVIQVFNANTEDAMFEVIYRDGGEESKNIIHIRKAPGAEDISGDYNQYAESSTETVGEAEVTMKGADGKVHLATWAKDGYTYSINVYAEAGISSDSMAELVAGVR